MNKLEKFRSVDGQEPPAHGGETGLKQAEQGVALLLRPHERQVRLHGLRFAANEGPSVVLGGRKRAVEGVY